MIALVAAVQQLEIITFTLTYNAETGLGWLDLKFSLSLYLICNKDLHSD